MQQELQHYATSQIFLSREMLRAMNPMLCASNDYVTSSERERVTSASPAQGEQAR